MDVLTYSDTRANLKDVMDRVVEDRAPVIITRQKAEAVVMVSLADVQHPNVEVGRRLRLAWWGNGGQQAQPA